MAIMDFDWKILKTSYYGFAKAFFGHKAPTCTAFVQAILGMPQTIMSPDELLDFVSEYDLVDLTDN